MTIEYRNLGASGLKVSTLCLGTMTFGENGATSVMHQIGADDATSFAILNRALDAGINFIDTADVYGDEGMAERIIGRWFTESGRRDEVVLATKFRFRMSRGVNGTGASRFRIMKTCEESLRRLQTDHIDLYQIHAQDLDTPEEETLRALDDLVRQGKVRYLGCSNYAAYHLVDSLWTSKSLGLERFVALQAQYSLIVRELEREHVPTCQKFGLGLLPWSPLASGFLSGKWRRGTTPPEGTRMDKWKQRAAEYDNERNWRILDALDAVCGEVNASPASVALAWLLQKPAVTSVIFGARTLDQLEDNLKATDVKLSNHHMQALDEASRFELGYPYAFIKQLQGRW